MEDYLNYITFDSLLKGLNISCSGVRWKTSVTQYELNRLKNTAILLKEIKDETYKISKYQEFDIYEPKHRHIKATRIRDRQVQRCICEEYVYKAITKSFIYDNCACQIGKGTLFAIKRLKKHIQTFYHKNHNNNGYILKCDIHHFFESIDHTIAKKLIEKQITDIKIRQMIFDIIDSFGDKGIGLGSQVSQLIALLYLNKLDHFIKEKLHIKYYVRYMDDFILIHKDKEYLKYCLKQIIKILTDIKLELNNKTEIQPLYKGIMFLNWRYILTDSGKVILIPNKYRLTRKRKKLNKLKKLYIQNKITMDEFNKTLNGMIVHLKCGNAETAIRQLSNIIS